MIASWVVVANAGLARIFSLESFSFPLEEIKDIANKDVHLLTSETESDQIGQRAASKSKHSVGAPTQPSGYQPHQSPEEHRTELFARRIADFLLQGHNENKFRQLILISSPEFLGQLRKVLDRSLTSLVALEINKDYTHVDPDKLIQYIQQQARA